MIIQIFNKLHDTSKFLRFLMSIHRFFNIILRNSKNLKDLLFQSIISTLLKKILLKNN